MLLLLDDDFFFFFDVLDDDLTSVVAVDDVVVLVAALASVLPLCDRPDLDESGTAVSFTRAQIHPQIAIST